MYKVLFVDDEPWVIIDILHSIPWGSLGFEVAGSYEKAPEAREAILALEPHLVFVDINMPVMDGFELIRQCRESGSRAAFVILSAHSDFEFAQMAIRSAVLDYCLKPVNPPALIKLLEELRRRFDRGAAAETGGTADIPESPGYVPQNEQRFRKMLDYIRAGFREKISLRELSERFFFSEHYICHLFKKFTGGTFAAYLLSLRIEAAKRRMETTDLPLRVIAEESGFTEGAYFSRVFKRVCGVSPYEYRLRIKAAP
jgi:two-component system response regulator YesN